MKLEPTEAQRKAMRHIAGIRLDAAAHHRFKPDPEEFLTELIAAANSIPEGAPVGTIARRPDGIFLAVRKAESSGAMYWQYWAPGGARIADGMPLPSDADSWPVIYDPDEYHEGDKPRLERLMREPSVFDADPTAQQEPALRERFPEQASAYVADPELAEVDDEPLPSGSLITPKPRTPRVVDRLGVDEQGSRWLDANGKQWSWSPYLERWGYFRHVENGSVWVLGDQDLHGPFREILEPHVLPSLDCEEARDGTVWEARYVLLAGREQTPGWKFQHTQDGWVYEDGSRVLSPEFLTGRGPYTEVLGDPS
ncbi:Uncharacterised protein [Mycobacteroides abscessus subsp. abscessus]|uniref:hypothetical protein n=1 Tax=Mycobacteroides abscessus TaxID=36809 RepID=UPI000928C6F5|nr:hypothetical protein [Mycobacteroides abscessus]SHU21121.1 Uncharacterised protein [Mycobacteroides abscessus subsp. abscessus]SHU81303.1 Uncharacterised protein [Mycobacteroides abscessus subsp. abscessus]